MLQKHARLSFSADERTRNRGVVTVGQWSMRLRVSSPLRLACWLASTCVTIHSVEADVETRGPVAHVASVRRPTIRNELRPADRQGHANSEAFRTGTAREGGSPRSGADGKS